jgi:hypothetical protein
MKKFPLVEINWVDAEAAPAGWVEDGHELDEPVVLRTFGLLIRKDKNWVVHASTYDLDSNMYSEKAKIPAEWVRNIRIIEEVCIESSEEIKARCQDSNSQGS